MPRASRRSRRVFIHRAVAIAMLGLVGCGQVPEENTIDTRAEGVRPNRVRGKPAGSPVSTEPDPPAKGSKRR